MFSLSTVSYIDSSYTVCYGSWRATAVVLVSLLSLLYHSEMERPRLRIVCLFVVILAIKVALEPDNARVLFMLTDSRGARYWAAGK